MKRVCKVCIVMWLLICLSACGSTNKVDKTSKDAAVTEEPSVRTEDPSSIIDESDSKEDKASEKAEGIDVDLTTLSSTMVYSEVYNMMTTPDDYMGKTVKMDGTFSVYEDENTGKTYFACLVSDATACCSQGIEFCTKEELKYPEDYPEVGAYIKVTGTFDKYDEDGTTYCQLIDAKMETE